LLPKLEKDARFDANQANIAFWETFTKAFLDFEKDAKPIYAAIYSLGLKDAEKIISKLDTVYNSLIKELAENHVLGITSEAIVYLITSKNSAFEKEVHFFIDLENAIKKVERKRIKTELPVSIDKLSFEISDDAIALAITKKERETLKEKMNAWDKELVTSEESPVYSVTAKKETKVISLSWLKYAAAACIVLTAGIMYFKFNPDNNFVQPVDTYVVTAPVKQETITPEIPSEALAEVAIVTKNAPIIESGLGFASKNNNIKIVENNQKARMESIITAIEKYRQFLEKEFPENKQSVRPRVQLVESKISTLQNELAVLKEREKQYLFNGKVLTLYVSDSIKDKVIFLYEDQFYLKEKTVFYKLTLAKQPQFYIVENNLEIINALEKIEYDN
jgi:ribosomal protein S17E/ribosomal protein S13